MIKESSEEGRVEVGMCHHHPAPPPPLLLALLTIITSTTYWLCAFITMLPRISLLVIAGRLSPAVPATASTYIPAAASAGQGVLQYDRTGGHLSPINPSNAEPTFIQSSKMHSFLKAILTLSCWYSLVNSKMSTHMPGFQSFFRFFLHHFVLPKLATSSIRVKWLFPESHWSTRKRFHP